MPDQFEQISFLQKYWSQILAFGGVVACWIRMEYRTKDIHKMVIDEKSGRPTIIFTEDCKAKQSECQRQLLKSIEEVKIIQGHQGQEIAKLHSRIDETNKSIAEVPQKIINLLISAGKLKG